MTRIPPAAVVRAATAVRTRLQAVTRRMVPAEVALLELASGFMATHAVYAAARLRLADALAGGPLAADAVAARCGSHPDATRRLLRACATYGLVRADRDGCFALTPTGSCLRSGTPDSMLPVVLMLGDPAYQGPWGRLTRTVESGRPTADEVLGMPVWDYLDHDPAFAATFNEAMTRLSALDWPAIEAVYDFNRFSTVVDVGGGHGELLALVLGRAPAARGVLLEREVLVEAAERHLVAAGVLTRCRVEAGSFFEAVPRDGDLYVLRRVLHDFDDERAAAVLRTVRRDMPADATLLLVESVVPDDATPHFATLLDLDMMLFTGGRERTEAEFAALLDQAGFRAPRVVPTISTVSLIESGPAVRS